MEAVKNLATLLIVPGGLFLLFNGLIYEWIDRKLIAQFQNRVGPRWFQPLADTLKLLAKEEIVPAGADKRLFHALPIVALAGALTAALYVPIAGVTLYSFAGDLIVTIYLLSLLTICLGVAGTLSPNRFSIVGTTRTLTQLFSYEAPFLLALLGPAIAAGTWQISEINEYSKSTWLVFPQIIGFTVATIGLMGKLELPPFDAPKAKTEIVAGALTEYSGRGYALFHLGKAVELVIGLTLISAFFLNGVSNPFDYLIKTLLLLLGVAGIQALLTRLRIDQTVGLWWRYGALLVLAQLIIMVVWKGFVG